MKTGKSLSIRSICFGVMVSALAAPAHAVEDCFSDYCSSTGQPVLGFFPDIGAYPQGDATNPTYFGTSGMIDFDVSAGQEIFAIAGSAYFSDGLAPNTQVDQMRMRMNVYDGDALARLSSFQLIVATDEYLPLSPGSAEHVFYVGGGIVNGSAGSRLVGALAAATSITDYTASFVKIQVYDLDGNRVWKMNVPGRDGALSLMGGGAVVNGHALLFGDFLNGDGVDELRVIYSRTDADGKQVYRYAYYDVDDGSFIRTDKIVITPP